MPNFVAIVGQLEVNICLNEPACFRLIFLGMPCEADLGAWARFNCHVDLWV